MDVEQLYKVRCKGLDHVGGGVQTRRQNITHFRTKIVMLYTYFYTKTAECHIQLGRTYLCIHSSFPPTRDQASHKDGQAT